MAFLAGLKKQAVIVVAVALWVPAVAFGINALWTYATTPGRAAETTRDWPGGAPIKRAEGQATLVMFVHPQCPCTAASLGELAIIMAHAQGQLEANVFF